MRDDPSPDKPAWRILWTTVNSAPREYVTAPIVRILERGPVRVAIEIARQAAGSTIVQRISLLEGGDRVDVENLIDWKSPNTLLKASFPFAASNPKATYDLGLGTIERGNNTPDHYEVPAQKWADLTDAGGTLRRRGTERLQVRLGQTRRSRTSPYPAAHAAAACLCLSAQPGHGQSPLHVFGRRPCGRLAGGPCPGARRLL